MKIIFKDSKYLLAGYYALMKSGQEFAKNEFVDSLREGLEIHKQNIDFHHTKLARAMLLVVNDKFETTEKLNETDKFDLNKAKKFIPEVKRTYSEFQKKEIKLKSIKLDDSLFEKVNKAWDFEPPNELTICNNPFQNGGHLHMMKNKIVLTLNPYMKDNMIMHILCHEYSHYFQNKLFEKIDVDKYKKLYKQHENYSEWKSYFAENLVDAVIIALIRTPPKEIEENIIKNSKLYYLGDIVRIIREQNYKKIGVDEIKYILKSLSKTI